MKQPIVALLVAAIAVGVGTGPSSAAPLRGDVLYQTTLLRAAPGRLLDLVGALKGKSPWISGTPRATTGISWS